MQAVSFPLHVGTIAGLCWQSADYDESTPTVLCLHGWLDNCHSFLPLISTACLTQTVEQYGQALPQSSDQSNFSTLSPKQSPGLSETLSWRFIAIDWPGHGHSDHKPQNYHFADWIDDLHQVIQALGPVHLVGHSLGGMVASCFTAAFPEYVRSLVLLESAGPLSLEVEQTSQHLRHALLKRQPVTHSRHLKPRSLSQLSQAKARALALPLADAVSLVARDNLATAQGYRWRHDEKLHQISPFRLAPAQAEQLVASIQCPTFCLLASNGYPQIAQHFEQRKNLFQQLQYQVLPGQHHFHITHAAAVSQAVKEFFVKL